MVKIIEKELNKDKIQAIIGTGDSDKAKTINIFKEDKSIRFMIATDAFAYGVDMPFATTVINFDIPWNPAKLEQRINRIYRINSKKRVKVINFVSEGLEEYIFKVMTRKKNLYEQATTFNIKEQLRKFMVGI